MITSKEIKLVILKLLNKTRSTPDDSTDEFYQTFGKKIMRILPKSKKGEDTSQLILSDQY